MDPYDTYSVLIAEDEMPARELLVDYLLTRPELKLSGIAKNGAEALEKLSSREYDLAFIDIDLPRMTGIEVLEKLKDSPYIIFTTAHEAYAIKAFDFGAVDYLLKPFTLERFNLSIDKFLNLIKAGGRPDDSGAAAGFTFKEQGKHYILPYDKIIYFTSHGKKTIVHTDEREYESHAILKFIESRLPQDLFIRIHKQYIVNIRQIKAIEYYIGGQYIAFLNDSDESSLPVGKKYAPFLRDKLQLD
jgi:DNA-binding LytR/AlgR family response regulator